ncbi:MAG: hypothetical protein IJ551_09665 [Prevotella sp.]|nr:hypothetical protein [Prevotella sp.]
MDSDCGVHVVYGKDDIIQDCKYCGKTNKKGFGKFHAYGYECRLKIAKRKANRCRWCYFGRRH